ncbi:MAG: substrate-binding domain-containing protein [Paracoccaceae bacterium]|nr:substrate-binding domain-containing protein [Paracoccaceae bacterium]MDE2913933.1 substrate-binding domain-containing protein [Paracoccaceae bacterium]
MSFNSDARGSNRLQNAKNLKQLAEALGLSQTTVSRALNGYPEVKEATRLRVRETARRLNYSPNARAQGLATGRAMAIGHVIPVWSEHEMTNPIFGDFVAGASSCYSKHGYDMVLTRIEVDDEENAYRQLVFSGRIDGIIVQGPRLRDSRISLLKSLGVPFVVHGRSSGIEDNYNWVDVNNKRSFKRATELLLDLGHRRIALLNGLEYLDFALRRRDGYMEALSERGIEPDLELMRSAEMTEHFGHRETRAMLQGTDPPTAVLASSKLSAMGVRRAIEERGLTMGHDVSVVTHDDVISYLADTDDVPVFTATRSSVRDAGRLVAEMLMTIVKKPDVRPRNALLETELVVGQSTGPCLSRRLG